MKAVVVGAGFAGLAAAQALATRGVQVVVIERDDDLRQAGRRGVPQAAHLHNVLGRAQLHLDELFPGWRERLIASGCGRGTVSLDTGVFEFGHEMPRRDLGFEIFSTPRASIDSVLLAIHTPETITGAADVQAVVDEGRCTGVTFRQPSGLVRLDADLVVDCSGPTALSSSWLAAEQVELPVDELQVDQWYATTRIEPLSADDLPPFLMTFPTPPDVTLGALVSPAGDGTFTLSVNGRAADPIPRTVDELGSLLRMLATPSIATRYEHGRAHSAPSVFRRVVARWRRHDLVPGIAGLIALGDSIGTLNPLFGQGMSVAAWQASLLAELAGAHDGWERDYVHAAAIAVAQAWSLGRAVDDAVSGRSSALARLMADDPEIHRRYVRTWHLLESPGWLNEPDLQATLAAMHEEVAE